MKSIVLKEWMRITLSICLLGLPVILGYFSIQIVEARNAEIAKNSLAPDLGSDFDFSRSVGMGSNKTASDQALPVRHFERESPRSLRVSLSANTTPEVPGRIQDAPRNPHKGAMAEEPASAVFTNYGDMLTKGQFPAAAVTYLSELFRGFTLHKNGRLIDTASYIHSTIR